MKRNKKIVTFFVCFIAIIVAGLGFWAICDKEDFLSTEYEDNYREDVIVYGGKEYQYNEHLSNYLFLGIDTREAIEGNKTSGEAGQADAIFVISYDRVQKTVKSISIPRDTMTMIHTFSPDGVDLGHTKNHINLQYAFGDGKTESCVLMKEAVENLLYQVPIQGYCAINMDGIPIIADLVGGVDLVVQDDSLAHVDGKFQKGSQVTLTKEDAELFLRYRDKSERHSAITRTNRQKVFLKAFAETAKERSKQDAELVVDMYESLQSYMVTNIGNDVLSKILQANYDSEQIFSDIPGKKVDGSEFDEYHVNEAELYELVLKMFYKEVQDDKS